MSGFYDQVITKHQVCGEPYRLQSLLPSISEYEAPPLRSAFRFPFVRSMVAGDLSHDVKSIHERYGPIVRVAPEELSFINPTAWKDIYTKDFLRLYTYRDKPPGKDAENLISASETDHHAFRKILDPAFVQSREQEAVVQFYFNLLISKLRQAAEKDRSQEGAVVDVLKWFNYTTFDIIGDLECVAPRAWANASRVDIPYALFEQVFVFNRIPDVSV